MNKTQKSPEEPGKPDGFDAFDGLMKRLISVPKGEFDAETKKDAAIRQRKRKKRKK